MYNRRNFIKSEIVSGAALVASPLDLFVSGCVEIAPKPIKISRVSSNFEREPLIRPFGFKGGYITEIWQSMAYLESDSGNHSIGLCTQSVLWSDASVFASHSESGGNSDQRTQLRRKRCRSLPDRVLHRLLNCLMLCTLSL